MRFTSTLVALAVPFLASAAPIRRAASDTDMLVLQFAHVLELLETQFYTEALQKFKEKDFTDAGFTMAGIPIQQFQTIVDDEASHVSVLADTIIAQGGKPIDTCKFDFSSVLTDVKTMAPVARLVEQVGVGAYLGAAALVEDKQLLTAAGSILTIEARHQTMLNVLNGGTTVSQPFDVPLTPNQVLAIAGPFISGCDLGVPANPTLSITNKGAVNIGTKLEFSSKGIDEQKDKSKLNCQMMVGSSPIAISLPIDECIVPDGINGVVYIYITNDTQPLQSNLANQFQQSIIAGPTIAFIDSKPDMIGQLLNNGGNRDPIESTQTISPAEATKVAAGASPSSTGSSSSSSPASKTSTTGMGPGPDFKTGASSDSAMLVLGWSNLPSSVQSPK
jgi:hypothetical protein